jgi:hypothetical protein
MTPATVSLQDLDSAFADVRGSVAKLGSALFELDAERETRASGAVRFTGTTEARWSDVVEQISVLWAWYQAVSEVVAGIEARRGTSRIRQPSVTRLWEDLHSPTIVLEAAPETGGPSGPVPLAAALVSISSLYQQAAETLASLLAVEQVLLPRLDEIQLSLRDIQSTAAGCSAATAATVAETSTALALLRQRLIDDPLSVDPGEIADAGRDAQRATAEVQRALEASQTIAGILDSLEAALQALGPEISAASAVVDEADRKIRDSRARAGLAGARDSASALQAQISAVRTLAGSDPVAAHDAAPAVGQAVRDIAESLASLQEMAEGELERRRALRGRLDAYQAKARVRGYAEDPALDAAHRAAEDELYSAPCDLGLAEQLVSAYSASIALREQQGGFR